MTTTEQWTEAEARKIILQQSDAIVRLTSERDSLRAENAALHKTVIDAMAAASEAMGRPASIVTVIDILDTAPEPSDETLAIIEETDTGGDDA